MISDRQVGVVFLSNPYGAPYTLRSNSMARAKIMIADARPGAMAAARSILLRADYEVVAVNGAADAIRAAVVEEPDVVVLDVALATPNTLREFSRATRPDLPVILTVPGDTLVRPNVTSIEGVKIVQTLHKPLDDAALLAAVERACPDPNEDPTIEALDADIVEAALDHGFTDETFDESDVSPRARWLADRIGSELPGLTSDPVRWHALNRACARALDEDAFRERTPLPSQGEIALEGRVGPLPVEQVFHIAENILGDVCVCFEYEGHLIDLFFRDRELTFARGSSLPEGFALGRFIVDDGALTMDELETFVREESSPFRRIGTQLIELGYIDDDALTRALEAQVAALAWEAMRWPSANFTIYRDVIFPRSAQMSGVELSVPVVLLEGMRRMDDYKRVMDSMGGISAIPVRLEDVDTDALEALPPSHRQVLVHVDGSRNVEDLARSARRPTYEVCCTLRELRGRRMVTLA